MLQIIGLILPEALAIAYNPFTLMAVIIFILSQHARKKTPAYVTGWVIGLFLLCCAVYLFMAAGKSVIVPSQKDYSILQLVLGLLFAVMTILELRHISAPKDEKKPHFPWGDRVEIFSTVEVFGLGLIMAGLNLKNAALIMSAFTDLEKVDPLATPAWVVIFLITIIGSLTTLAPWLYFVIKGPSVKERLHGWMEWIILNHSLILAILFFFFSVTMIGNALVGLAL